MSRLMPAIPVILALLALPACGKRPPAEPPSRNCTMPADCVPGQACVSGRCMTDLTRRQQAVPAAQRVREQVEQTQRQGEERRDRALEDLQQQR